jgi:DNA-3-methyladenine glycosylase II
LDVFPSNQVVTVLTNIKGIGQWTAEMFLIFSLGRMDVLSLGDVGLQRSCKWLYSACKEEEGRSFLVQKANQWHPYYTIASLYLWEAINRGFVDSFHTLDEVTLKTLSN